MREMSIQQYLDNPSGLGASVIPNRELIRGDLTKRFQSLYEMKQGSFAGNVYKSGDDYFIHVVIPSESKERENTYDVVIKFNYKPSSGVSNDSTVKNYPIQVFSNSPSFTYTYAYVFNKEKLLVDELRKKYRDETFEPPTTRNPYQAISYEKTTFMAIMYILTNPSLMEKIVLNKGHSVSHLVGIVRNTDEISIQTSKEKNRLSQEKTSSEIKAKKEAIRNISIDTPTKKPMKTAKTTARKPQPKTRPKPKVTGRSSLKRQRGK